MTEPQPKRHETQDGRSCLQKLAGAHTPSHDPQRGRKVKPQAARIVIAALGLVQAAIVGFALGATLLEFTP